MPSAAAMPQRRGAAGGDAAAELSLREGLRELLNRVDRSAGGTYGGGGGGRGGSANRGGGHRSNGTGLQYNSAGSTRRMGTAAGVAGERRPQLGDWVCSACGFGPNFARRRNCFECRRPRSPRGDGATRANGNGGGLQRGPINAEGLRPVLGRRGPSPGRNNGPSNLHHEPTFRVPGASVAARAAAATTTGVPTASTGNRGEQAQGRVVSDGTSTGPGDPVGGGQHTSDVDADGFQMVHRRGWKKGKMEQGTGNTGGCPAHQAAADKGSGSSDDRGGDGAGGEATAGEGGDAPTPTMLHQEWHDEIALVKRLKQQGIADDHPAMRAACSARDTAEQRWRKAKDPTPASVRLSRAQSKLDKAINAQAETRRAMLDLEKDFRGKQAVLQARLDEETARVRTRRQQLDEVQEELASDGRGGRARAEQGAAVRQVHGALCNEVAPTIATLIEQLDSATPAWAMLNGLLSTLTTSKALLERAIPTQGAQAFVISDDADGADEMARDGRDDDVGTEWSESHEVLGGGGGADDGDPRGDDDCARADDDMGVDAGDWWEESHHQWQRSTRWQPAGYGKWARSSWADSWEREYGQEEGAEEQPPAARRRLDDRPNAAAGAGAVAATPAAEGDATDAEQRIRQHRARVDLIIERAIEAGIQPITPLGEDLHILDPHALDAWVAEHFPGALQG